MITIETSDLSHPAIAALLQEHLDDMALHSPPESIHALDLSGLQQPDITFWCAWESIENQPERELKGCVALKQHDSNLGEIKSMRTSNKARGQGIGKILLEHLLSQAKANELSRLSLETGSMAFFEPARQLYARYGFEFCGPFAQYIEDPNSQFMTLALN